MRKNQIKHKKRKIIIIKNEKVEPKLEEITKNNIDEKYIQENHTEENEEIGRVSFEQKRIDFISSLSVENEKKYNSYERRKDVELKEEEKKLEMLRRIARQEGEKSEEEIQNEKEVQEFFEGIDKRIEEIQKRQKETNTSKQEIERTEEIREKKEEQSKEQNDEIIMNGIVEDIKKQLKLDKKGIEVEAIIQKMIKENKYKVSPIRKNNKNSTENKNNKTNRVSGTSMEDIFNSPQFKKMWESQEQEER